MEIKYQVPSILKISSAKYFILFAGLVLLGAYPLLVKSDWVEEEPQSDSIFIQVPISETDIKDFTIHRSVIERNLQNVMAYYSKPEILNVMLSSMNQSMTEMYIMITRNRETYDEFASEPLINGFMDTWIIYRYIQLTEYIAENMETLTVMFQTFLEKYEISDLFCAFNPTYQSCDC